MIRYNPDSIPMELFAPLPWSQLFTPSNKFILKEDEGGNIIEYRQLESGFADIFEVELFKATTLLFTDKTMQREILFTIDVQAGLYRFLKACIPYVYMYVLKETPHNEKRWITKDADAYISLYKIIMEQTIDNTTFYYHQGTLTTEYPEENVTINDEDKAHIDKFVQAGFLRRV